MEAPFFLTNQAVVPFSKVNAMRRTLTLLTVMVAGAAAMVMGAQPEGPPYTLEQLEDDLYILHGGCMCGNTTFYITDAGVVMVDTKVADKGAEILDQLRTVTNKPIAMIINTHTHFDHTGSNAEFGAVDRIVVHDNANASLRQPTCGFLANCDAFKGENAQYLPNVTFQDQRTLMLGQDQIDLHYFGPGHTNGDLWVVFPERRVAVGGDLFGAKSVPYIDTENGGTALAFADTMAKAVAGLTDVDTVISGHVDAYPFDDLVRAAEFHEYLENHIVSSRNAGRTPEETRAAFELPEHLNDFGFIEPFAGNFIQLMYDELDAQ